MIKNFLSKTSAQHDDRKIFLAQGIAKFLIVMGLPYISLFILFDLFISAQVMGFLFGFCLLSLGLIHLSFHRSGKFTLITGVSLMLLAYSILLGAETGAPLIFFPIISLGLILFERHEIKSIIIGCLIPVFCRFLFDFITYSPSVNAFFTANFSEPIATNTQYIIYEFAVFTSFSFSFFFVFFYFYSNYQSEKLLTIKNEELSKNIQKLDSSNSRLLRNYLRVKQMITKIRAQQAMEADLEKGKKLQNSALPQQAPQLENVIITHAFEPAKTLSGDYFDYFPDMSTAIIIPKPEKNDDEYDDDDEEETVIVKQVGIVVADVVGKGVAASLEMFSVKTVFKLLHDHWFQPKELVARLNQISLESHLFSKYVPLLYVTISQIDPHRYRLKYVNAGHEPAIIVRKEGTVEILDQGGAPVGMDADETYIQNAITLYPGDVVYIITDGCTDVKSPTGEVIGHEELIPILIEASKKKDVDMARYVRNRLRDFQAGAMQADDMTIVVIQIV